MLTKLALLFLAGMGLLAIISGRPRQGDRARRRPLSWLRRRRGSDDDPPPGRGRG
ncbi:MAG: hypothetical protein ACQEUZ_15260 [Pseudomonadota bacterium]